MITLIPRDSRVAAWIPVSCPSCSTPQLALVPTVDGDFDAENCSLICPGCNVEFHPDEIQGDRLSALLPDGHDVGAAKYNRGRSDYLIFGKNLGTEKGNDRNQLMRLAVEAANPNIQGIQAVQTYYELKGIVGVPESKAMKSALEMTSRKIIRVQQARHMKIPEPTVDKIAKLIRKGINNSEARRPSTSRERKIIIETVMERIGVWPP